VKRQEVTSGACDTKELHHNIIDIHTAIATAAVALENTRRAGYKYQ
jgi:hypothetical protein